MTAADNGARFRARVTNAAGTALSNEATLTVTSNQAPTRDDHPASGRDALQRRADDLLLGTGTDPEDGNLPASAYTWQVDFHHAAHMHPFIAPTSGATSGSFVVPTSARRRPTSGTGSTSRSATRAASRTTVFRDVNPRTVQLTLATSPAGLSLRLDDQPQATPLTVTGVVGVQRTLEAPSPQTVGRARPTSS